MKTVRYIALIILAVFLVGALTACGRLDKTELEEVLNREYDPAGYTEASYQNYLKRYNEAMDVYNSDNTTAYRIENATVNLLKAIDDLVAVADFTELLAEISEEINPLAYTNASYQVYKAVYDSAVIVASDELSKQSVVNNALRNLRTAKKALVPKTDTSSLAALLEKEYKEEAYTRSSYESYRKASDAARALMHDDGASESDVRLAVNGLQQAISRLIPLGSAVELKAYTEMVFVQYLNEQIEGILPSQRYSTATLEALKSVYDKAERMCVEKDSSQAQVDQTLAELQKAVSQLVDKISLYEAIERMDIYLPMQNKYTAASFDNYLFAVTKGMTLNNSYNPTVPEIMNAVSAIEAAEKALMRRPLDPSGKTDFDLASAWVVCYDCRVSLEAYFYNYAGFYNQIFESVFMIEQSGGSTFRLRDGYSITMVPGILSITDVGRTTEDASVMVMGVSFNMDEYAVGELLGAPTEYKYTGNMVTLLYEDDTAGIYLYYNFTNGKLDSIMITQAVYPMV